MAEISTIARPYATAVFNFANESKGLSNWSDTLVLLSAVIQDEHIKSIIDLKVPIVFTSAGNPKAHTARLKAAGITVVHVVSSKKFALKAQEAGVDAIVAEGFEAGGHNGREETTTLCLIPSVAAAVDIPVIASGGVGTLQHLADGVTQGGADAVLAASIFHFGTYSVPQAKAYMAERGIEVRL